MSNSLEKTLGFYNYLKQKEISVEEYFSQIELDDFTELSKNEDLNNLLSECGRVVLSLNTCNGLSEEVLSKLSCNEKIKYQFVEDSNSEGYSLEELINVFRVLQSIKNITDGFDSTIEKIVTVCIIVTWLVWPEEKGSLSNEDSSKEMLSLTRSLKGSFFRGIAVCQGYALTLKIILNYLGIETFLVAGYGEDSLHAWNQVKDDIFYNLDLTYDWHSMLCDMPLNNTLKSDAEFYQNHKKSTIDDYTNLKECPQSVSNQELRYYTKIIPEELRKFLVNNQKKGLDTIRNYKFLSSEFDSKSPKM